MWYEWQDVGLSYDETLGSNYDEIYSVEEEEYIIPQSFFRPVPNNLTSICKRSKVNTHCSGYDAYHSVCQPSNWCCLFSKNNSSVMKSNLKRHPIYRIVSLLPAMLIAWDYRGISWIFIIAVSFNTTILFTVVGTQKDN